MSCHGLKSQGLSEELKRTRGAVVEREALEDCQSEILPQRLHKADHTASPCSNLTEVRVRCDPMLCRRDGAEEELVQIAICKVAHARRLYDAGCRTACAIKAGWRQVIADEGERRRSRVRDGKCDVRGSKPERVRNNATK